MAPIAEMARAAAAKMASDLKSIAYGRKERVRDV